MRTIETSLAKRSLGAALREQWRADYVYAYPPRQAYYPVTEDVARTARATSLADARTMNLYVHVPFCRQICAYCNLFAVAGRNDDDHASYVDLVMSEFRSLDLAKTGNLDTLYIGGGTPSLMDPALIGRLVEGSAAAVGADPGVVREVALEVAPDTVDEAKLASFRAAGINRINLGVQSWDNGEIHGIGRSHGHDVHHETLTAAMATGFDNVCVDLIYGLPGQSMESWTSSLHTVISYDPDTICCYALTLRPNTGFAARGHSDVGGNAQYAKYDIACSTLAEAGYEQETHVRWIRPGRGGYVQKANHWAGQNVLGVGAGARSYLRSADLRNGYSTRSRRKVLRDWAEAVRSGRSPVVDGYLMDHDERARKAIILGLGNVNRGRFRDTFGDDPLARFDEEMGALAKHGLIEITPERIALTNLGHRHRDVAVQLFFSDAVTQRLSEFDYATE